jgi:hypothetical protein
MIEGGTCAGLKLKQPLTNVVLAVAETASETLTQTHEREFEKPRINVPTTVSLCLFNSLAALT